MQWSGVHPSVRLSNRSTAANGGGRVCGIDVKKRSNKTFKNVKKRKNVTEKNVYKRNKNVTSS